MAGAGEQPVRLAALRADRAGGASRPGLPRRRGRCQAGPLSTSPRSRPRPSAVGPRSWRASSSIPSMPSVPLIRRGPPWPSALSARSRPRRAPRPPARARPRASTATLAEQRQAAVGERSEITAGAERAVLRDQGRVPRRAERAWSRQRSAVPPSGPSPASGRGGTSSREPRRARRAGPCPPRASGSGAEAPRAAPAGSRPGERTEAGRHAIDRALRGRGNRATASALSAMAARAASKAWPGHRGAPATTCAGSTKAPVRSIVAVSIPVDRSHRRGRPPPPWTSHHQLRRQHHPPAGAAALHELLQQLEAARAELLGVERDRRERGSSTRAKSMSSKPTTAESCGMRRPRSRAAR